MTTQKISLAQVELQKHKAEQNNVTVFLTNGVKLGGKITGIDLDSGFCSSIRLSRDGIHQVVMINAISSVMPCEVNYNR